MMISVMFGVTEATIDDFQWTSPDAPLADLLNTMLRGEWLSPSIPDADRAAADDAAKRLGGRIVNTPDDPIAESGRIY